MEEHNVFCEYADKVERALQELRAVIEQPDVRSYLHGISPQCLLAVKYELPNLLLEPLYHLHHYVACIKVSRLEGNEGKA